MKRNIYLACIIITAIGAVNWGMVGLFNTDLVALIFGSMTIMSRIVYTVVAIAGIGLLVSIQDLMRSYGRDTTTSANENRKAALK